MTEYRMKLEVWLCKQGGGVLRRSRMISCMREKMKRI